MPNSDTLGYRNLFIYFHISAVVYRKTSFLETFEETPLPLSISASDYLSVACGCSQTELTSQHNDNA